MSASPTNAFNRREYQRRLNEAESLQDQGDYQAAAALLKDNLAASTQHFGIRHAITLNDQDGLSDCLHDLGEYAEAAVLDRKTLRVRKGKDEKSPATLATQQSLANNLSQLRQHEESIALNRSILAYRVELLGDDHNDTLETRHQLAYDLHRRGEDKEASQLNAQILHVREQKLGSDNYNLIASRHNLATNLHALKKLDKAMALTDHNLTSLQKRRPGDDQQAQEVNELKKRINLDIRNLERQIKLQRGADQHMLDGKQAEYEPEQALKLPANPARRKSSVSEEKNTDTPTKSKEEVRSMSVPSGVPAKASPQTLRQIPSHNKNSEVDKTGQGPAGGSPVSPPEHDPKPKSRARSNERKARNEPRESGLRVPSTREKRSRSVGASSSQEGGTIFQRSGAYNHTELCDSKLYEGSLYDTTHTKSNSGWFGHLKTTQELVAKGRKASRKRVKIAILDTGIDLAHAHFGMLDDANPDYGIPRDRVKECFSFVDGQRADRDTTGHGTHAAALLLALAPKANVYVGAVVDERNGNVYPDQVAKAILHATNKWKVNIITMSLGWPQSHRVVERAILHATMEDVIICAAASNNGAHDNVAFPANCSPVLCVHSTNELGKPSEFTPTLLEMRPNFSVLGEKVRSTWPGMSEERACSGTSIATPMLAAVMALILEFMYQKPNKTDHDRWLQSASGMTHLLQAVSKQERGYHLVQPWTLYDSRKPRERVESKILDIMEEKFGHPSVVD